MNTEEILERLGRVAAELHIIGQQLSGLSSTISEIGTLVTDTSPAATDRLLYTTQQAADMLALSRTTVTTMIASNELPSIKLGGSRRVPAQSLHAYLASLQDQS